MSCVTSPPSTAPTRHAVSARANERWVTVQEEGERQLHESERHRVYAAMLSVSVTRRLRTVRLIGCVRVGARVRYSRDEIEHLLRGDRTRQVHQIGEGPGAHAQAFKSAETGGGDA